MASVKSETPFMSHVQCSSCSASTIPPSLTVAPMCSCFVQSVAPWFLFQPMLIHSFLGKSLLFFCFFLLPSPRFARGQTQQSQQIARCPAHEALEPGPPRGPGAPGGRAALRGRLPRAPRCFGARGSARGSSRERAEDGLRIGVNRTEIYRGPEILTS